MSDPIFDLGWTYGWCGGGWDAALAALALGLAVVALGSAFGPD